MEYDYEKIDALCEITLTNIYTKTKNSQEICLNNFDPKNEEHLFFLHIASMARDLFSKTLTINCGFFKRLWINFKIRKEKIKFEKSCSERYIDVPEILDFMRPLLKELLDDNLTYSDIYNLYYTNERDLMSK